MQKSSVGKGNLLGNFLSLVALQGASYILPLLTLPYLVRILGVEKFGLISFAQAITAYFCIFVDYGFNLSATMAISVNRHDSEKVSEIFSAVMLIKIVLLSISFLFLIGMLWVFPRFQADALLFLATFGMVAGTAFYPVWYFQGIENMKVTSGLNIGIKLFFTLMVFLMIGKPGDYLYAPLLNSIGFLMAAGIALVWIAFSKKIRLVCPTWGVLKTCFSESTQFFLSRVANDGNQAFLPFIIGMVYGNTILGIFSMVEKLYRAFYGLFAPILLTLYPYMTSSRDLSFFKKVFWSVVPFTCLVVSCLTYNNVWIIRTIFGVENPLSSTLFIVLFSGSIFGVTSSLIGYPLLAAFGFIEEANYSLVIAAGIAFVYTGLAIFLNWGIPAVVASSMLYEALGCVLRFVGVYRRGIWKER